MTGKYFIYCGESSADHDLVICAFDNSEIPLGLSRSIIKGETNRFKTEANHLGTSYDDPLQFQISFVKDDAKYASWEDRAFTEEELRKITAWLTSPVYPQLFHMYSDDGDKQYDYYGLFTGIEPFQPGGEIIHGFTATFATNSPYAWSHEIRKAFTCSTTTDISITCETDEHLSPVYPTILLKPHNTGVSGRVDITIKNHRDKDPNNRLALNILKTPISIHSKQSKIKDALGLLDFEDLGITDAGQLYWPRLWYGENKLTITGDTDIEFIYREPRKAGAY